MHRVLAHVLTSLCATACALCATACAPNPEAPVRVMALVQSKERSLEPTAVELTTLESLTQVRGRAAELLGDAHIRVDSSDPALASLGSNPTGDELERIFVKDRGSAPEASFVDKDGVYWPSEFHAWNMVTTYFNFERALDYFETMGVDGTRVERSRVYYFPEFVLSERSSKPMEDNALFFSPIQGFAILPFDILQKVPLGMNLGVVAHEFSHRVFNARVYGGEAIPAPFIQWSVLSGPTPAINVLKSLDEGLADYHAHGATCLSPSGCDPRFIESSLPQEVAAPRDLSSSTHCMSSGLRDNLLTQDSDHFSGRGLEYLVGTALASALYQAAVKTDQQVALQQAILQAYSDESRDHPGLAQLITQNLSTPEKFTLELATNALVAHVADPALRRVVCNELLDHLQLLPEDLPDCPASAAGGTTCEDINP